MQVRINDFTIEDANVSILPTTTTSSKGKVLRRYDVEGTVIGEVLFKAYTKNIDGEVDFEIIDQSVSYKAKLSQSSSSYSGFLHENTIIHVSFVAEEIDPNEPLHNSVATMQAQAAALAIESRVRLRALTNLLVEKGVFTEEEFNDKLVHYGNIEQETMEFSNRILYKTKPDSSSQEEDEDKDE